MTSWFGPRWPLITILVALAAPASFADDTAKATRPPAVSAAAPIGGAIPGGAIISARFVRLTPVAGGDPVTVPIASDGSFRGAGLKPGAYHLVLTSGSTPTEGAKSGDMPARISMNVTVGRQNSRVTVDGAGTDVTVGADGTLSGRVSVATD